MCDATIIKDFEHRITLLEAFRDELLAKMRQIESKETLMPTTEQFNHRRINREQEMERVRLQAESQIAQIGQEIPLKIDVKD